MVTFIFVVSVLTLNSVYGTTYPLFIDILADPNKEDEIRNVTESLIQFYTPLLAVEGVSPVSFSISTNNEVPGISSPTKRATNSSFYIDTRQKPSSLLCTLYRYLNVTYIRTSVELTNKCQPIRIRPSVTEYFETAQQIFEYGGRLYTDVILLDEFQHDLEFRIFTRGNYSLIGLKKFTMDGGTIHPLLHSYISDGNTQLFIFQASYEVLSNTMSQISSSTITRMDHWIVIPTDSFDCPTPNTTFFFICLHHNWEEFKLDQRFPATLDEGFIANSFSKLLEAAKIFTPQAWPLLMTEKEKFSQHIYSFFSTSELDNLTMIVDKISVDGDHNVTRELFGNWSRASGLFMKSQPFDPIPASLMTVVVIHEPPFVERIVNGDRVTFQGYSIDVLDRIASEMGFTYIAREVRDGQYGVLLPNGTWTGIIGEVSQGYADLGVGPISTTAERETVIDFTAPYYDYAGLQILIYHSITPTSMFGFVEAFDGYVWLVWMAFLVVTSTLLFVFHFLTYKVFSTKTKEEKLMSLSDALWFVMASISLQGPDRYRISFSSRVLVIGFWFFCQIMLATYTANMAAFMTSKRLSFDIKSLADLNDQNTLAYSALSGSASETYFRRMTAIEDRFFEVWRNMSYSSTESNDLTVWDYPLNDLYTRIFKEINKTGFITTSAEGVQRVLNERFAFIHETPMIKYEQTKHCNLEAAGEIFSSKPYAFVLPENSPLKKNFNSKILGFQSGTFLNTLKEKWWPDTLNCETEDDSTAGLPLNNLLGVIIMTSVGCALGIIILALEIYFYRRTKHKLQMKNSADTLKENIKNQNFQSMIGSEKKPLKGDGIMTLFNDM